MSLTAVRLYTAVYRYYVINTCVKYSLTRKTEVLMAEHLEIYLIHLWRVCKDHIHVNYTFTCGKNTILKIKY